MTRAHPQPAISLDQQHALHTAAARLAGEFSGRFIVDPIERRVLALLDDLEVPQTR